MGKDKNKSRACKKLAERGKEEYYLGGNKYRNSSRKNTRGAAGESRVGKQGPLYCEKKALSPVRKTGRRKSWAPDVQSHTKGVSEKKRR